MKRWRRTFEQFREEDLYTERSGKRSKAYLSCLKDSTTRYILAYHISLQMNIIYQRLREVIHPEAFLHSNQGIYYTHPEFQKRVRKMQIIAPNKPATPIRIIKSICKLTSSSPFHSL